MALPRWIRIPLILVGSLVALAATSFAVLIGYSVYMNERAASGAGRLCAALHPGMTREDVAAAATGSGARTRDTHEGREYFFQGAVFGGSICKVAFSDGRVTRTEVLAVRD